MVERLALIAGDDDQRAIVDPQSPRTSIAAGHRRDGSAALKALAERLKKPGLPSQVELARGAGVDQPPVSRARRDELVRYTDRVRRLDEYVDMRIGALPTSRRTDDPGPVDDGIGSQVIDRCRDFLAGGGDPNLLLDQLALLRRAGATPRM